MPSILTPIQQLTTAQRVATIQQMSKLICENAVKDAAMAGRLSTGNQIGLIGSLNTNYELMILMTDLMAVTKYLLIYFSGEECNISHYKLTPCQKRLAIIEIDKQIALIKNQPISANTPNLQKEKRKLEKIKAKLEAKLKLDCSCCC